VFWIVLARRRGDLSKTGNSIPSEAIYDDEDFAQLFEVRRRPTIAPWDGLQELFAQAVDGDYGIVHFVLSN
jgi:hypothetical protein